MSYKAQGFHWNHGIYFKRNEDGSVLMQRATLDGEHVYERVVIPAYEWCSIIANCSPTGETTDGWEAAKKFHIPKE